MKCGCTITTVISTVFLFFGLFSCVDRGVTDSGGGVDIGNPVEISVVDVNKRPVADASVTLIPSDNWFTQVFTGNSTAPVYATTDGAGVAIFDSLDSLPYTIQVDHPSGGALVPDFHASCSPCSTSITLNNYGTVSGTITSSASRPAILHLTGTTYRALINPDGSYTLPKVAPGIAVPVIMSVDSQWTLAHSIEVSAATVIDYTDDISFTTLLIDDFEDSKSTAGIRTITDFGGIYHNSATGIASYDIVAEGYGSGNALKGVLIRETSYALIGYLLGKKPDGDSLWDFTKAKGLSFYGKGNGKLNVSIESDTLEKLHFYKHYSTNIILQEEWRQFTIPFDSLTLYDDDNPDTDLSWKESASSIKRIEFNLLEGDTATFWIDNLIIEGIDFSAVF